MGAALVGEQRREEAAAWNAAVVGRSGSFLQSWEWGALQEAYGRRVFRVEAGGLLGQAIEQALPFGSRYFYIPRGPVVREPGSKGQELGEWVGRVQKVARAQHAAFLRIDPSPRISEFPVSEFLRIGFRDIGRSIQPKQNLIIDLTKPEEELLAGMREKTRYNIRVAERHGVETRNPKPEILPPKADPPPAENKPKAPSFAQATEGKQNPNPETFWRLLDETAKRQKMRLHPRTYYEEMLKTFTDLPSTSYHLPTTRLYRRLYLAFHQEKPLAAALVVYFGKRATYLHGGSSLEQKNVMAPYALHWQILRDAKTAGFIEYDFGGIDDKRWPGLTRFKKGFGGRVEEFPNAYEFPLSAFRYRFYRLARRIRA